MLLNCYKVRKFCAVSKTLLSRINDNVVCIHSSNTKLNTDIIKLSAHARIAKEKDDFTHEILRVIMKTHLCFVLPKDVFNKRLLLKCEKSKSQILVALLKTQDKPITLVIYTEIFSQFQQRTFRVMSTPKNVCSDLPESDEEKRRVERAWCPLYLAYTQFLRFLESPNLQLDLARLFIDKKFIMKLLELFNSESLEEREFLKNILCRIYSLLADMRSCIQNEIINIFYRFIYEEEYHNNGIAELLMVFNNVVTTQMDAKDRNLTLNALLTLHKSSFLSDFYPQVIQCVLDLLKMNSCLFEPLIRGLIKIWPKTNSAKELLELFNSEALEEREFLKNILCRIYSLLADMRSCIQNEIINIFYRFIYEEEYHNNGIAELLMVFNNVVTTPMDAKDRNLTLNALLTLHKSTFLSDFYLQVIQCVLDLLKMNSCLFEPLIRGLIKIWPKTNSTKEVIFLDEIRSILDIINPCAFEKIIKPLFNQLAKCFVSFNRKVANTAFELWLNQQFRFLVTKYGGDIYPIIFDSIYRCHETHWDRKVKKSAYATLLMMYMMSTEIYDECLKCYLEKQGKSKDSQNVLPIVINGKEEDAGENFEQIDKKILIA